MTNSSAGEMVRKKLHKAKDERYQVLCSLYRSGMKFSVVSCEERESHIAFLPRRLA